MMIAIIAVLFTVAATSHALVIDDFRDGAFSSGTQYGASYTNATAASVPGGQRTVSYTRTSAASNVNGYDVSVYAGSGLYLSNDSNVDGTFTLTYGGRTSNPLNLNLNLTAMSQIQFAVPFNDMSTPFDVTLFFNGGATSVARSATASPANNTMQTLIFDFSGLPSAQLGDVDEIRIFNDFPTSNDYVLRGVNSNASPVLEPATLAALGLGTAAMLRRRRKA